MRVGKSTGKRGSGHAEPGELHGIGRSQEAVSPQQSGHEDLPERSIGFSHMRARALRTGDWKLVWSKRMPHEITWELYNLSTDRSEMHDLAKKHPERVEAMAAEWDQWARRVKVIHEE